MVEWDGARQGPQRAPFPSRDSSRRAEKIAKTGKSVNAISCVPRGCPFQGRIGRTKGPRTALPGRGFFRYTAARNPDPPESRESV